MLLSGITAYRSALPYSLSTTQLDADPFADWREPRNSRRARPQRVTDVRASKVFRPGRYTVTAFWEIFNVFT